MLINCHTYHSYKFGTIAIKTLLEQAQQNGFSSIVLSDINNTSASSDFIRLASKYNIKPIVGIDFRNGAEQKYIGIARNKEGFKELNIYLSNHLHLKKAFENEAPNFENVYVVYPFKKEKRILKANEFVGIRFSELNLLPFSVWKNCKKLVILHPVTFSNKREFNSHRLLRAIDKNILLSQLSKSEEAKLEEQMPSFEALENCFEQHSQIIANTKILMNDCNINFQFNIYRNKTIFTDSVFNDAELLKNECEKGLKIRYGKPSKKVITRYRKELKLILELNFCAYFLINWDLVNYAKSKNYYHVGRGSGANSIVAYLLGITDVDPLELDLYFERFINPSRKSPPDFDIDFSSKDRNDVTKYIFETHENTALVGSYISFQEKSVLRELGKVFGMPAQEIDKLQRLRNINDADDLGKLVLKYSNLIAGLPSHMSVHACGIVISQESIYNYTATNLPPKGFATTHFSMLEAEDIGLAKFDILGQRGLGKIKDCIELIQQNQNIKVDIRNIKKIKEDVKVKKLIKEGDAVGCFYVESPAMRNLLKKLQAEDYIRLVAASSIIRPGVSQSGMMREYILRYRIPERRIEAEKALPALYDILRETYGVMVYQEDVIKVAHLFAKLTLAQADVLRRGMSGKYRSRAEFLNVKKVFFDNCTKLNYGEKTTNEIWRQIESFAGFAFPKGHSASYAVESMQALFLKAHFPIEYMVATINNGGGFYSKQVYIHEAKMHGAKVELPCVNNSEVQAIVKGKTIYLGLSMINTIEVDTLLSIFKERNINGHFLSLQDFVKRVIISLEQIRILVRINAFRFTGKTKKELLWNLVFMLGNNKKKKTVKTLFYEPVKEFLMPDLHNHPFEQAYDEIELINFSLQKSVFEMVKEMPKTKLIAKDLNHLVGKNVEIVGHLIHRKRTRTQGGKEMSFGTFLDLEGKWLDTVQFPEINNRFPFQGYGCYLIKGKVIEEFDTISIETLSLKKLVYFNMEDDVKQKNL